MNILVAEDDPVSRMFLQILPRKLGHTLTVCEEGALAWQAYQEGDYDIIISDWMMPEMDGLERCRNIRKLNRPDHCYFIMATARAERADFLEAMEAGADDYVTKPVRWNDFLDRLDVAQKTLTLMRA